MFFDSSQTINYTVNLSQLLEVNMLGKTARVYRVVKNSDSNEVVIAASGSGGVIG